MVTRIRNLTTIHPKQIYHAACQEHINKALATVASKLDEENKNYFSDYGTTWELANYNVQLKLNTPLITIGNTKKETTALAVYALQLHAHISQDLMMWVAPHVDYSGFNFLPASLPYDKLIWGDFRINGISEDMMDTKFEESTL
eukprot:5182805-Ditylum_brightwellii.AAC.1